MTFLVKRDISSNDEEGIKMKEQAILSLGNLLSKHGKAEGKVKHLQVGSTSFRTTCYNKCKQVSKRHIILSLA